MKIEITIPVWGNWVLPWRRHAFDSIRAEADSIGASLIIYTDADSLRGFDDLKIDGFRQLAKEPGEWLDRADLAAADAIDRALAGCYVAAPLVAAIVIGRGTMAAARRRIENGYHAVMTPALPGPPTFPPHPSAMELAQWQAGNGFLEWKAKPFSKHPTNLAWRCGAAVLVRPMFLHPVLLRPLRAYAPRRSVDHFMTEGYLCDIRQVAFLDPCEGNMMALQLPQQVGQAQDPHPGHDNPPESSVQAVAEWARVNVRDWNLHYLARRFWFGEPGEDRLDVEMASDQIVDEIWRLYDQMPVPEGGGQL